MWWGKKRIILTDVKLVTDYTEFSDRFRRIQIPTVSKKTWENYLKVQSATSMRYTIIWLNTIGTKRIGASIPLQFIHVLADSFFLVLFAMQGIEYVFTCFFIIRSCQHADFILWKIKTFAVLHGARRKSCASLSIALKGSFKVILTHWLLWW